MKKSTSNNLLGRNADELVLTYAGEVVKHLGVQMYAGRPVPAIAELISNAWDADARNVRISLPLDKRWSPSNNTQTIVVADDGNGMSWEMVRDAYLDVGRDRRLAEDTDKSPGGRLLQGRKGVGKLAGFGIADVLEVQTVYKAKDRALRERVLIWFELSIEDLKKRRSAPVRLIYAGPISEAPTAARTTAGTTITLRRLHERRAQNAERFHHSMAQRFLLIGPKFNVEINGQGLRSEHIDLQWRWPNAGWQRDSVKGYGPISYWIGFTPAPRKQSEGEMSGILIYTRGKVSQDATFFDISGGVTGQHGLRYLVGMVRAEWLDASRKSADLIATHRGAIAWESPAGAALQDWGQRLVRKYLAEWARLRTIERERQIKEVHPALRARIQSLAPSYRDVAVQFVEKFKNVEMEPEEFEDILGWFLDALENATLRSILIKLKSADIADLRSLDELLSKMEVRTAVTLLQIIESNLAAIEALERMHKHDARERGVIAKHIERNPWLIDPTWILNKAEARVATWIHEEFQLPPSRKRGDRDRADFFCVAVGGTLHIVEIKRGRYTATSTDILQADKYRVYVEKRFRELTEPQAIRYGHVQSHLIAASLHEDAGGTKQAYADKGWVFFATWDDLIERAKIGHHQFRDLLQQRAATPGDGVDVSSRAVKRPQSKSKSRRSPDSNAPKKAVA